MTNSEYLRRGNSSPLWIAISLLVVLSATTVDATQAPPSDQQVIRIVQWGEFGPAVVVDQKEASGTQTRTVKIISPDETVKLLQQTNSIQAKLGVRFGIQFQTWNEPFGRTLPVTIRILHPAIIDPKTKEKRYIEEWTMEASQVQRFAGWSFDAAHEIVAGEWIIQVIHEKKVEAQQSFLIYIVK